MPPVIKGIRHTAREYALRVLYGYDILRATGEASPLPPIANWWETDDNLWILPEAERFARELISYYGNHREEVDQLITQYARNWRLERLNPIDRNILRISISELFLTQTTPKQVILNEAVELAKGYGDEKSPKFVNGILDPLADKIRLKSSPQT